MARPGSAAAARMFTEAAPSEWEAAESLYSAVVCAVAKARKSARLVDWNRWLEQDCPRIVKGTGKLGMADMEIVMQWKITKGKFRPLMSLLRSNSDQDVEDATRKAFQLLDKKPRFRPPVEALCSLRGIGPATASAVLAHVRPQQYAFMSGTAAGSCHVCSPSLPFVSGRVSSLSRIVAMLRQCALGLIYCRRGFGRHRTDTRVHARLLRGILPTLELESESARHARFLVFAFL
jgi:hypothetical protein